LYHFFGKKTLQTVLETQELLQKALRLASTSMSMNLARSAERQTARNQAHDASKLSCVHDRGVAVNARVEAFAAACRSCREEGRLAEAQATLRQGLALHPSYVRLLVEQVLLDNAEDGKRDCQLKALSPMRDPSIEIIVCVHNALDETKRCLDSICAKTTLPYFLTIVADASAPEVGDYLNAFAATHSETRILSNPTNIGYSKSANRGIKAARADWVVLLNSDTIVTAGWLEGLVDCALTDEAVAAVGPLSNAASIQTIASRGLSAETAPENMATLVKRVSKKRYPRVPFLCGFCTLVSRAALEKIGYLDDANFSDYCVDDNMSLGLLNAGYKLSVADDVYVHHLSAASFGKGAKRDRMIAEAREKLKSIWPGYDFSLIVAAADLQLNDIKAEITKAL
jgi:GT2 family glycosyltransferase